MSSPQPNLFEPSRTARLNRAVQNLRPGSGLSAYLAIDHETLNGVVCSCGHCGVVGNVCCGAILSLSPRTELGAFCESSLRRQYEWDGNGCVTETPTFRERVLRAEV